MGSPLLTCFGEGTAATYIFAWKQRLEKKKDEVLSKGIPESSIDANGKCLGMESKVSKADDIFSFLGDPSNLNGGDDFGPTPFPRSTDFDQFDDDLFLPQSVLAFDLYSNDKAIWVPSYAEFHELFFHHAVIGTNSAHDQMTSFPTRFRNVAFYHSTIFRKSIQVGYIAQNHVHPHVYDPLKEENDYGFLPRCPLDKLTFAEADQLCYSSEEATYRFKILARLERSRQPWIQITFSTATSALATRKIPLPNTSRRKRKPTSAVVLPSKKLISMVIIAIE